MVGNRCPLYRFIVRSSCQGSLPGGDIDYDKVSRFNLLCGAEHALPLCALFAAGCSNPNGAPGAPPGPSTSGSMGGSGGPAGGPADRETGQGCEVPAVLEAAAEGTGGGERLGRRDSFGQVRLPRRGRRRGPRPETYGPFRPLGRELTKIIHDGKPPKMPAFGSQLSDAQIKTLVAYLKQLKPHNNRYRRLRSGHRRGRSSPHPQLWTLATESPRGAAARAFICVSIGPRYLTGFFRRQGVRPGNIGLWYA